MALMTAALLALALGQAAQDPDAPKAAPAEATSTVSGVVVPSPKAKEPPKVYTPTYKAAPHLAPSGTWIGGSTDIDQIFADHQGANMEGSSWRTYSISAIMTSQLAAQRYRAKKAADLINAGRCPEALQGVYNEGDAQLTIRVAEVCGLPSPMERPKGPPF